MTDPSFTIAIWSLGFAICSFFFAIIVSIDTSRFSASMKEIVDFFIENEDALIENAKQTSLIKTYKRNQALFIFSIFKSNAYIVGVLVISLVGGLLIVVVDTHHLWSVWGPLLSISGFSLLLSPIIYTTFVMHFVPVKDGIWVSFDDAVKRRKIELNEAS